jgi:site-specific recombinase XerD
VGSSPSLGTLQSGKHPVSDFLESRRQGLSPQSIEFYQGYVKLAATVIGFDITGQNISLFLSTLSCTNGGKHAYYRALRAFYNWLYSRKSGYNLNAQDNSMLLVESPKVERKILPSLTTKQLDYLTDQAECMRDKAIISLLADSGLKLS